MNINSVSAANVPVAGQTTGQAQTAQIQNTASSEAAQPAVTAEKAAEEPAVKVEIGKTQTSASNADEKCNAAKVDAKESVFQTALKELDLAVAKRTALIKTMPPDVRKVTQEILSKTLADTSTISEGLMATIKAEKSVIEQLQTFVSLLADAEQISRQVPEDMLKSFADLLQNIDTKISDLFQKTVVPEQAETKNQPAALEKNNNAQPLAQSTQEEEQADSLPKPQKLPESEVNNGRIPQTHEAGPNPPGDKVQQSVKNTQSAGLPEPEPPATDSKSNQSAEQAKDVKTAKLAEQNFVKSADEKNQTATDSQRVVKSEQHGTAFQPKADILPSARQTFSQEAGAKSQQPGGQVNASVPESAQNTANSDTLIVSRQVAEHIAGSAADYQPQQFAVRPQNVMESFLGTAASSVEGQSDTQSLENMVLNLAKQLVGNNLTLQTIVKNAIQQFMQQSLLPENDDSPEATVLKQTLENFTQNAPEIVKFAAGKHNLPQLPQLWALVKLHKALEWTKLDQEKLQQSIRDMREMIASMKKSVAFTGEKIDNNTAFTFSMPLYLGEGLQPYPAYIHLYHQRQKGDKEKEGEYSYETWLRICLGTENIGPVDIVFRLYQENLLNVKVSFLQDKMAESFSRYVPDIREALDESALNLVEVSVNTKPDLGG